MPPTVLIVDDETPLAAAIETYLSRQGLTAHAFDSAERALAALAELAPDIALVDIQLPGMDGLTALRAIRRERPETLVILMTAYSSVAGAIAALRGGAVDYLVKPIDLEELSVVIQRTWETHRVRSELSYLRQRAGHAAPVESLLGTSAAMAAVRRQLLQVAGADRLGDAGPTVLLTGETGTGKELAARAIHAAGPRAHGPFVELNCAAIPATLLEGELFGFEKGAYTDARQSKPGLVEAADGGTLFLDEIGLLDGSLQAKLLKVLEDGAVRRLGALRPRRVDVRILAAANQDLEAAVRDGSFRADLLYRLRVLTVSLPPLRGRVEDIELLCAEFLRTTRERYGLGDIQLCARHAAGARRVQLAGERARAAPRHRAGRAAARGRDHSAGAPWPDEPARCARHGPVAGGQRGLRPRADRSGGGRAGADRPRAESRRVESGARGRAPRSHPRDPSLPDREVRSPAGRPSAGTIARAGGGRSPGRLIGREADRCRAAEPRAIMRLTSMRTTRGKTRRRLHRPRDSAMELRAREEMP